MKYRIVANSQYDIISFNMMFGTGYINQSYINPHTILETTFEDRKDVWDCIYKFNTNRGSELIRLIGDKE